MILGVAETLTPSFYITKASSEGAKVRMWPTDTNKEAYPALNTKLGNLQHEAEGLP
jgi:hypothetical protein